jgi:hypothetical protein
MNARTTVRYVLSAAVMGALATASACCPGDGWEESRPIDIGVSADLNAVAHLQDAEFLYLAVGSGGTVVAWADDYIGHVTKKSWTIPGDVELRGALSRPFGESHEWWVIGDGGFAAVTDDRGETWSTVDVGTTADLHAILEVDERLVVVGDAGVRVLESDGTWIEPPAPTDGWGQLRDVALGESTERLCAVGLGGLILTANGPTDDWVAEDSGTSADLFAVGEFLEERLIGATGATGTVVVRDVDSSEWRSLDSGIEADIIDYRDDHFLTADGELLEAGYERDVWGLEHLETLPGARALIRHQTVGSLTLIVVGEAGSVNVKWSSSCFFSKA